MQSATKKVDILRQIWISAMKILIKRSWHNEYLHLSSVSWQCKPKKSWQTFVLFLTQLCVWNVRFSNMEQTVESPALIQEWYLSRQFFLKFSALEILTELQEPCCMNALPLCSTPMHSNKTARWNKGAAGAEPASKLDLWLMWPGRGWLWFMLMETSGLLECTQQAAAAQQSCEETWSEQSLKRGKEMKETGDKRRVTKHFSVRSLHRRLNSADDRRTARYAGGF